MTEYVYLCYHTKFAYRSIQLVLDSEKEARAWVSRNPDYLDYEVWEVKSKPYE